MAEIWGAALAAGVALYGANKQAGAAQDAANAQGAAANQANATQLQIFNQQRADNEPFRQAGLTGLSEYMAMLGLPTQSLGVGPDALVLESSGGFPVMNAQRYASDPAYKKAWDETVELHDKTWNSPYIASTDNGWIQAQIASRLPTPAATSGSAGQSTGQQAAFDRFRNTPGYKFGLDEGFTQIQRGAAARSGLNSGAAMKELFRFGQGYSDQQGYNPYMNKLSNLFGGAQTANSANASAGQNYANQTGQNTMLAGQARASGIQGSADAWTQGIAGAAGAINNGYQNWRYGR